MSHPFFLFKINMIKTYKSYTHASINVVLENGKNLRISFNPLSNGSSTFTTDDTAVQEAIERHYNFGSLFTLDSVFTEKTEDGPSDDKISDEAQDEHTDSQETLRIVKVTDYSSARDYLAETFGISRTVLRSIKSITEQAAIHGIEFEVLS